MRFVGRRDRVTKSAAGRSHSALLLLTGVLLAQCVGLTAQGQASPPSRSSASGITTTNHPALPAHASRYWLVPDVSADTRGRPGADTPTARFARGALLVDKGDFAGALPLLRSAELRSGPLSNYVRYYTGLALLGLSRFEEAEAAFTAVADDVDGYLAEAAPLRLAEAAHGRGDGEKAADVLEDLSDEEKLTAPEEVLLRLGAALELTGKRDDAYKAYSRLYYEFPLSAQSAQAQTGLERLQTPELIPADRFRLELTRAERLFSARRWAQARAAFASLVQVAANDDAELVALRVAECDYYLDRFRASRDALKPFLRDSAREAEARFFYLTATRALGDRQTYLAMGRELVEDFPESSWAEETLNNLGTHYINDDDDEAADRVFRELMRRFPRSRYTERAAWKVGWRAYKVDQFADAAERFEEAAANFPRADYRPSWLYWAARSRDQLGQRPEATALYRVVAADYLNSYYGRLASAILSERREPRVQPIVLLETSAGPPEPLIPTDSVIRALIAAELYDAALAELEYARVAWGNSSAVQATIAWVRNRRGFEQGATDRFADVRGGITIMRRAYPQFMAAGGEQLPADVLRVIFPLDYWPLIRKYSDAHGLDPYLMTALIAQESTFTADVRSSANAVGLMQLIPPTARRYARRVGITYSARVVRQPESNIRMGMRYFKDLMDRFHGAHLALAGYNAGESRVVAWMAERPGFDQDEFIDDIPFPETQNYVKRILGTADDYRRLYGGGVLSATSARR